MTTLTDFLLARIAEDEEQARRIHPEQQWASPWNQRSRARMLAECEAKRRIVEACSDFEAIKTPLYALAAVYAGHPEFQEEWLSAMNHS